MTRLKKLLEFFEADLFPRESTPTLFNFYNNDLPGIDIPNGSKTRRENLKNYLESFPEDPVTLIIGEAPGHRGCRFTGVPFTCERQFAEGRLPFSGRKTSASEQTKSEPTANLFWEILSPFHPRFISWNCVPYHPHEAGEPLTNRSPSITELKNHLRILKGIISILEPTRIVAVGRKAEYSLTALRVPFDTVPHPARGNREPFRRALQSILSRFRLDQRLFK